MQLITWNVNGIRAIQQKGLLQRAFQLKPDILCLQETKADFEQFPAELHNVPGYAVFAHSAQSKKGYSGVAIYTKEQPIHQHTVLGLRRFDEEGRFLRLDFADFSVINLYMPQGGRQKENLSYKLEAYKALCTYVKSLMKKSLILAGDFNIARTDIDLARPKENRNNIMFTPEERAHLEELLHEGFTDTFRTAHPEMAEQYTWWPYWANARARNLGWRIDYVLVNQPLQKKVSDAFIRPDLLGSDHCPAGVTIPM